MKDKRIIRALLVGVLAAVAGTASAAAETMNLDQARKIALERNRSVVRAELALRSAEIAEKSAAAGLLPSISAGASWSAAFNDGEFNAGDPSLSLSASQSLYSGGKKTAAVQSARLATSQAKEDLRAARIAVVAETDARFLAALEKKLSHEAAVKATEAAALQLEIARAKREAGTVSDAELLQAQSSWATKRTAETQAKWAAETAGRSLASYLGTKAEPSGVDESRYEALARTVRERAGTDLEALAAALYERGREADPALRKKETSAAAAKIAVSLKQAEFFPTLSLSASLKGSANAETGTSVVPSFSLSASIPIFPISDRAGAVDAAKNELRSAATQIDDAEESLLLSFYSTTLGVLSAAGQIESADAAIAFAEANHSLALEKYRLGAGTSSAVADAESTLATARSQAISARFALYAAVAGLSRLLGAEDERGLADALR